VVFSHHSVTALNTHTDTKYNTVTECVCEHEEGSDCVCVCVCEHEEGSECVNMKKAVTVCVNMKKAVSVCVCEHEEGSECVWTWRRQWMCLCSLRSLFILIQKQNMFHCAGVLNIPPFRNNFCFGENYSTLHCKHKTRVIMLLNKQQYNKTHLYVTH